MFQTIGTAIYRRTVGETNPDQYDPPTWAWGVALVNLIVFLPLFIVVRFPRLSRALPVDDTC